MDSSAETPTATFEPPVVLNRKELVPTPALFAPVVLHKNEEAPTEVLFDPVVFAFSALAPTAVFVATAPAPLPTRRPEMEASAETVRLVASRFVIVAEAEVRTVMFALAALIFPT